MSKLTSITIPNSVTSIGESAFCSCTGLTSVNIPNSVTNIGYKAFYDCEYIETVVLGTGIKYIGNYSFGNNKRIYEVTCYATVPPTIESNTFGGFAKENVPLYVPSNCIRKYKAHTYWSEFDIQALPTYNITATCDSKCGTISGGGEYESGSTCELIVNANAGYEFVRWSNGAEDNP